MDVTKLKVKGEKIWMKKFLISSIRNSNKFLAKSTRILEQCNDVEKNPGPFGKIMKSTAEYCVGLDKEIQPPVTVMNGRKPKSSEDRPLQSKCQEVDDLRVLIERQAEHIEHQRVEIQSLKKKIDESERKSVDFSSELSEIRRNWLQNQVTGETKVSSDVSLHNKLDHLLIAYNDIQDRLYEIDKTWRNNLIFYGIPADAGEEDPLTTEDKVRNIIRRKLHITRDIPMNRVLRIKHGPEFRGQKPIQVHFANYNDKEEVLRKAKLLRGGTIHISEDFSRKVREHRQELIKFMKEIRSRDPARRMVLRYDKLYMGRDVFFFNDRSLRVERLHQQLDTGTVGNPVYSDVITEDARNAQESSWHRRPRSRIGSRSRAQTPVLSRQNSLSMDDLNPNEDYYGTPQPTPMRRPNTSRTRSISRSVDSLQYSLTPCRVNEQERRQQSQQSQERQQSQQSQLSQLSQELLCETRARVSIYREQQFSSDEDVETSLVPPETPKKSPTAGGTPSKTNPFPKLAVPRSAKERERRSVVFKDSSEDDDEVLSLDYEDQKQQSSDPDSRALVPVTTEMQTLAEIPKEEWRSNMVSPAPPKPVLLTECTTELVSLLPHLSGRESLPLVPYEKMEISRLNLKSGLHPALSYGSSQNGNGTMLVQSLGKTPYSFSSHFASVGKHNNVIKTPTTEGEESQRGTLKLNVAIAGEFSMGTFKDK